MLSEEKVESGSSVKPWVIGLILLTLVLGITLTLTLRRRRSVALPPLTDSEISMRARLRADVNKLASEIGERNTRHPEELVRSVDFLDSSLRAVGYEVKHQDFVCNGQTVTNIEAEVAGNSDPEEIVIIGAHYDSVFGTPGANDNGSGVAAVLELARTFYGRKVARTLRFVFFVNEEPPYFQGSQMGSVIYAKRARERGEKIIGMLALETIGYYCDTSGCQKYPAPLSALFPDTGNFLAFATNRNSKSLMERSLAAFRKSGSLPAEGGVAPESIPGVGWSDHWSFWQQGYPAIMLTDTAPYRYPYYHKPTDTADKLDYDRLTRATAGIGAIVRELAE